MEAMFTFFEKLSCPSISELKISSKPSLFISAISIPIENLDICLRVWFVVFLKVPLPLLMSTASGFE